MIEFDEVYKRYFGDVYKYVLSLTRDVHMAEEITQETFFRAMRSIGKFEGRCTLYVWLCQIAKNTCFTYRQRAAKRNTLVTAAYPDETMDDKLLNKEAYNEICKILDVIGEPYKEVFSLRVFGDLPFRQIGELFGKTESWARVTYHRAKMKIKEKIQ